MQQCLGLPSTALEDADSFAATSGYFSLVPKVLKGSQTNPNSPGPQDIKSLYSEPRRFLDMRFKGCRQLCLKSSPKATCAFQPKPGWMLELEAMELE